VANPHQLLFAFQNHGPEMMTTFLQTSVLFLAVYCAVLLVDLATNAKNFTAVRWVFFVVACIPPYLNLTWLIPKVVSKLCIVTAVEFMKDRETIDEVIADCKEEQVAEVLRMLEILKLRGRVPDNDPDKREEALANAKVSFENMSEKVKDEFKQIFRIFDKDSSKSIDKEEFLLVLKSLGFKVPNISKDGKTLGYGDEAKDDKDKIDGIMSLFDLVDGDESHTLEEDEFYVLMALAFSPREGEDAKKDWEDLFEMFDSDNSQTITIDEVLERFDDMDCGADRGFIEATVFDCFRSMKIEFHQEEFVEWMEYLEEKYGSKGK